MTKQWALCSHTAVWSGQEMILFSGIGDTSNLDDTWTYTPGKTMFLYMKP